MSCLLPRVASHILGECFILSPRIRWHRRDLFKSLECSTDFEGFVKYRSSTSIIVASCSQRSQRRSIGQWLGATEQCESRGVSQCKVESSLFDVAAVAVSHFVKQRKSKLYFRSLPGTSNLFFPFYDRYGTLDLWTRYRWQNKLVWSIFQYFLSSLCLSLEYYRVRSLSDYFVRLRVY
jgi:hypothetical protein